MKTNCPYNTYFHLRHKRNEWAEMFFKPELLEQDYIFFPINRR